jgi:hypothetical protein
MNEANKPLIHRGGRQCRRQTGKKEESQLEKLWQEVWTQIFFMILVEVLYD